MRGIGIIGFFKRRLQFVDNLKKTFVFKFVTFKFRPDLRELWSPGPKFFFSSILLLNIDQGVGNFFFFLASAKYSETVFFGKKHKLI